MVRMRAMPSESSVVLNPVVQHPDHRYVPTLFYSWDYNIWCYGGVGAAFKDACCFPLTSPGLSISFHCAALMVNL